MTVVVTSGEPSGIGPDIIVKAAMNGLDAVVLGSRDLFAQRAKLLNLPIRLIDYQGQAIAAKPGELVLQHIPMGKPCYPGVIDSGNAEYVLAQLNQAADGCMAGLYEAVVTAPVSKACINQAGIAFSGHTEFFADKAKVDDVVMMLASDKMRVALVTTHLPLKEVHRQVTFERLTTVTTILLKALKEQFLITEPKVYVAGLNPHAGEGGYLGREEIDIMMPALAQFPKSQIIGPLAGDTLFSQAHCQDADAFLCMYHDQGLAVIKYASFHQTVNITLGLPFIRTSVDHGTALALAGTLKADERSFVKALLYAQQLGARRCELA